VDQQGNSPLHLATLHNYSKIVFTLLTLCIFFPFLLSILSQFFFFFLFWFFPTAAHQDINLQNSNGNTPLLLASHNKHFKIAAALIERGENLFFLLLLMCFFLVAGADVNIRNRYGLTPLLNATANGDLPLVKLLLSKGFTSFFVQKGKKKKKHSNEMGWFKGAAVSARDPNGNTPLHKAAQLPNMEILILLIEKGADIRYTELAPHTEILEENNIH
jgi:ankyrin repeat protein